MKRVDNSIEVRLRGWRAALRSQRTPVWLKPSLRQGIKRLSGRLRKRKGQTESPGFRWEQPLGRKASRRR